MLIKYLPSLCLFCASFLAVLLNNNPIVFVHHTAIHNDGGFKSLAEVQYRFHSLFLSGAVGTLCFVSSFEVRADLGGQQSPQWNLVCVNVVTCIDQAQRKDPSTLTISSSNRLQ